MAHARIREPLWPFMGWYVLFSVALCVPQFGVMWFVPFHAFWIHALGIIAAGILAFVLAFRLTQRKSRGFEIIAPRDVDSKAG